MNFNQLVLAKLGAMFLEYDLRIAEQFENYLKLQSKSLIMIITHNPLEGSNMFWIGRNIPGLDKIEIDNEVMREFFHSELPISSCTTTDIFIDSLTIFFGREGRSLLKGDLNKMVELEKYDQERSHLYTLQLRDKQNLDAANNAWEENNYRGFIKYMNEIEATKWPSSCKLKYNIAHNRLKV